MTEPSLLQFGQRIDITEVIEGVKGGNVVNKMSRVIQSIPLTSRKELWDNVFAMLDSLDDTTEFKVYRDKHTHEPYRIEVISETKL